MSRQIRCDFCEGKMNVVDEEVKGHLISMDGIEKDCCEICFHSCLILSEMRRTHTRKAKKGKK